MEVVSITDIYKELVPEGYTPGNTIDGPLVVRDIDYLKYRPEFGYYPRILSKPMKDQSYIVTPVLDRATEVLPSSIIGEIGDLLDNLDTMQAKLENCMRNSSVGDVSFREYKAELDSPRPNYDKVRKFENFHREDINGSMQGEIYPMVREMKGEMTDFRDYLNKKFYNGKADYDNINTSIDRDTRQIDDYYDKDIEAELSEKDIRELTVQSQLCKITIDRVINSRDYVTELNKTLCFNLYSEYGDGIRNIVDTISKADNDILEDLLVLNEGNYRKTLHVATGDKRASDRLNNKDIRKGITEMVFKAGDMYSAKSGNVLDWVRTVDTDFDQSALTPLVADTLDVLEMISEESKATLIEGAKHNVLDKMQKEDSVGSLLNKKKSRQTCNLISEIVREKNNGTFDLDKFLLSNKLETPGNMCTQ